MWGGSFHDGSRRREWASWDCFWGVMKVYRAFFSGSSCFWDMVSFLFFLFFRICSSMYERERKKED